MEVTPTCRTCREGVGKTWAKTREYRRTGLCQWCLHEQASEKLQTHVRSIRNPAMDDRSMQDILDDQG